MEIDYSQVDKNNLAIRIKLASIISYFDMFTINDLVFRDSAKFIDYLPNSSLLNCRTYTINNFYQEFNLITLEEQKHILSYQNVFSNFDFSKIDPSNKDLLDFVKVSSL